MNGQAMLQANPSKSRILLPQAKPNIVADASPGRASTAWLSLPDGILDVQHLQPERASEAGGKGTHASTLSPLEERWLIPGSDQKKGARTAEIGDHIFRLYNYLRRPRSLHQQAHGTNKQI